MKNPVRIFIGAALVSGAWASEQPSFPAQGAEVLSLTRTEPRYMQPAARQLLSATSGESTVYSFRPYALLPYRYPVSPNASYAGLGAAVTYVALAPHCDYVQPDTPVILKTDVAENYAPILLVCGDAGSGTALFTGERWRLGTTEILVSNAEGAVDCNPMNWSITDYQLVTKKIEVHPLPCHKPDEQVVRPEAAAGIALGCSAFAGLAFFIVKRVRANWQSGAAQAAPQQRPPALDLQALPPYRPELFVNAQGADGAPPPYEDDGSGDPTAALVIVIGGSAQSRAP